MREARAGGRVVLALLALLGGSAAAQEDEGRRALEEAQRLAASGRKDRAIEIALTLIRERPDDPWRPSAHFFLALLYHERRQFRTQLAHAEEALARAPEAPWRDGAELARATALAGVGRALEARPIVERLMNGAPHESVREEAASRWKTFSLFGEPAPALSVERWLRGPVRDLASLKGRVVLVLFFEGCAGCSAAYPEVLEIQGRHSAKDIHTIGIAVGGGEAWLAGQEKRLHSIAADRSGKETWDRYQGAGSP
ncbi:MAG: hypothetical protein HY720_14830, partial [Planctomycetes bacterium]|nr:hypothetical protein [Planctomycetota bacterium]